MYKSVYSVYIYILRNFRTSLELGFLISTGAILSAANDFSRCYKMHVWDEDFLESFHTRNQ